jgi:LCP family protein required for cell wall assembly
MRRTWPQRLTLLLVVFAGIASLGTAGVLAAGQWVLSDRRLVELGEMGTEWDQDGSAPHIVIPGATTTTTAAGREPATTTTIALAEPGAANFLITGADNGDCANVNDPTVGERGTSVRSDTIMVWRVNPQTNQLAVLSFPRDLWVDLPGGRKGRINEAYRRDEPERLRETIFANFGVPIDHFIQIDFCAFRTLVDAVGGVTVPFEFPARDEHSGLDVPTAGCVNLDGNMALAYVRSRHYHFEDPPGSGNWESDGTSDFGRISRQQDFIRRVLSKVIAEGLYKPDVVGALVETNRDYLVTDAELTPRRILEFANTLRSFDPAAIGSYRIQSSSANRGTASVQIPEIDNGNMRAILAVFRGEATLADAPEQVFATSVPSTAPVATAAPTSGAAGATSAGTAPATTSAPLPTVIAEDNNTGVSPDPNMQC